MKTKLPPKFKKKYLEALRSGDYEQGKTFLLNQELTHYCPLGVACKVAGVSNDTLNAPLIRIGSNNKERDRKLKRGVPKLLHGYWEATPIPNKIAGMSDKGKSFEEIADYIEENL